VWIRSAFVTLMTQQAGDGNGDRIGRFCHISDIVPAEHLEGDYNGLPIDLLETSWVEIVGPDLGAITRPLRIKRGAGAKAMNRLYLETPGSCAQKVRMCLEDIIDRVNSTCGYAAVQTISIEQTTHDAFAHHMPRTSSRTQPPVQIVETCEKMLASLAEGDLRDELMKLCITVMRAEDAGKQDMKRKSK